MLQLKTTFLVIIFWNFTMFQNRSDSTQVKLNVISSITNLVGEQYHELPNDLKPQNLNKLGDIRKITNLEGDSLMPSLPSRNKILAIAVKKLTKCRYQTFLDFSNFTEFPYIAPNISGFISFIRNENNENLYQILSAFF